MRRPRSTINLSTGPSAAVTTLVLLAGLGGCASVAPPPPEAAVAPRASFAATAAPLTVEQAIARALDHDPELRAARHRVTAAYWHKVQAALPANPALRGTADPGEWVLRLAAQITDLLDLGGGRRATTGAAASREQQAALAVMQRQIDLVRAVRRDFAATVIGDEQVRLQQRRADLLADVLAIARQQQALGELAAGDVLQLERRLLEASMAARDQDLQWRQTRARLNRWLGLAPTQALALTSPAVASLPDGSAGPQGQLTGAVPVTRDSLLVDLGALQRPELALLAARAREQQALLRAARVVWLDVEGGPYLKQGDGPLLGGAHAAVTLPVFDRGQARRGAAASALAALEEEFIALQAVLLLEVHDAWWQAQHRLRRYRDELPALRAQTVAAHALQREAQALGAASALQVHLAELEIITADLLLLGARLDALQALADLAAVLGDRGETAPAAVAEQGRDHDGQD